MRQTFRRIDERGNESVACIQGYFENGEWNAFFQGASRCDEESLAQVPCGDWRSA